MPKVGEIRAAKKTPTLVQRVRALRRKAETKVELDSIYVIPSFAEVLRAGLARRRREYDLPF